MQKQREEASVAIVVNLRSVVCLLPFNKCATAKRQHIRSACAAKQYSMVIYILVAYL